MCIRDRGTTPGANPGEVDPVADPAGTENDDATNLPNDPADPTEDPTVLELAMLGNVSGNVSEDTTGDGAGDTPLPGVDLELFTDPNGDGDPSDGVSVGTATTDANGDYVFEDVPLGDYVVVETQPTGVDSISEDEGGADDDQPDNGTVNSIAVTVDATDPDGNLPNEDVDNNFVEGRPSIELIKSISAVNDTTGDGIIGVGDTVEYTFEVTNTGVTELSNVTVSDALLGLTNAVCAAGPIAPGATETCTTVGSYVLVQADVDAGFVVNTATTDAESASPVDGTPGTPVTDTSDTGTEPTVPGEVAPVTDPEVTETPDPDPAVVDDDADPTDDPTTLTLAPVGNVSGNVSEDTTGDGAGDTPLAGVGLELFTDPNGDGDPSDGVSVGTATTDANGDYVFENLPLGDYVVVETQPADLDSISEDEGGADDDQPDNGTVNSIAVTVDESDPDGNLTNEDVDNNFVEGRSSIELIKSISAVDDTNGNGITDAGDTVEYTFEVTNTGVTELSNVTVSDAKLGLTDAVCAAGPIAPGATETCTTCLLYTSPSPRDATLSRMPSSA